jgi:hypothetical protein
MPKVGLYIASSISSLDFDKIIEPYLKNKNLQVFSNFMHPSIKCFEADKALSTNLNAQCQQRISDTHVEFYKRYNGTFGHTLGLIVIYSCKIITVLKGG